MLAKESEKTNAISLRKQGLTYDEILKQVPVAKSTLSLWLREIGLAKASKQKITEKRKLAQRKAAQACHNKKVLITKQIIEKAESEIKRTNKEDLLLIGAALYWAEGTKERTKGTSVIIGNSDPKLVKMALKWLNECCGVTEERINLSIYIHESAKERIVEVRKYWSATTGFSIDELNKIVWKKNKLNSKRKNSGDKYFGLLRITVTKSINLNRKIQGWISGICKNCGIV
ncbi:MAG: hypothetical protein WCX69_02345 [Candidatus Paceibacterota bacterium]